MTAMQFAEAVITLALKHSFSVTSWGRTIKHNQEVGGVVDSYHQLWTGCDILFDGGTNKNVNFERDANLVGLQALWETNHYHLQPR